MEAMNWIPHVDLQVVGLVLASGFILNISALVVYRLLFHPLRRVPGPFFAGITYGYQMYYDVYLGGQMPRRLVDLHQKYGPIVRIAPDRVHVNDPEFYKRLFGSREDFTKSKYYYGNLGIEESIVTLQDVKAHRFLRNSLNPFFTPQAALDQRSLISDEIRKLLITLRGNPQNPSLADIQSLLGQLFVKLTCRTVFGLHNVSENDAATIFDGISGWFSNFNVALAFPLISKVALKLPDWITAKIVPGYLCILQNVRVCIEQCKARMDNSKFPTQYDNVFDMLQVSEVGGHLLNETQLLHEAVELLAGGVLPTNTAACYAVYFILTHPQVLVSLKRELAGLPKTADGVPVLDSTNAPYLTAIVKETLRLRPAAGPGFLPRTVPSKGVFIGNTFIPGGTNISTSLYSINTNPAVYQDPLAFNPNRWLDAESKYLEDWFLSFSKGPRMCLGKHIAMLSISSVLAALFSNFELTLHETNDETMEWRDQTLMVNKAHIKAFVTPIDLQPSFTSISRLQEPDTVIIPDLFVSWAATPIKCNPHYAVEAPKAEIWFKETCKHNEKQHKKYLKADFGYFAGTWAPDADIPEYITTIDYCNWVWAFDDPFDEGSMKGRPDLIKPEIEKVLAVMTDSPPIFSADDHPVLYTFQLIWQRILKRSTPCIQKRFRQHQHDYLYQVLAQSNPAIIETYTDVDTFCAGHRESVGAKPLLPIIEYCYGMDVPEFVFEDSAIQRIIDLQAELILLANDVYSYAREAKVGHHHNILYILRKGGMSLQEALDHVGEATLARYLEWDAVVEKIPSWGDDVDAVVRKYVEISRISVISNLDWSFKSQRYFGKRHEEVRKTRVVPYIPFV